MSSCGFTNGIKGGISFFSQKHGWACDNVELFELVLANSSVIVVSEREHPDLFWALRGGGNNFGIITSLKLDVFPKWYSYYTFQRWSMKVLGSVFQRLENHTNHMPEEIEMIATTLSWHTPTSQFVITERVVASEEPELPQNLPLPPAMQPTRHNELYLLEEHVYQHKPLAMSEKMDRMNPPGFFNFFASTTIKNDAGAFMALARVFQSKVVSIKDAADLQVYIVYNPLSISTIEKMQRRGGNALGIKASDGPLISKFSCLPSTKIRLTVPVVNVNLHWSDSQDTNRMRNFMRQLICGFKDAAESMGVLHPYLFQNHAFEEQDVFAGYGAENRDRLRRIREAVDPEKVFLKLQPGYYKLI